MQREATDYQFLKVEAKDVLLIWMERKSNWAFSPGSIIFSRIKWLSIHLFLGYFGSRVDRVMIDCRTGAASADCRVAICVPSISVMQPR